MPPESQIKDNTMKRCLLFIATILAMSAPLRAEDFAAMRQEVVKLGQLTASPARQPAQGYPVTRETLI